MFRTKSGLGPKCLAVLLWAASHAWATGPAEPALSDTILARTPVPSRLLRQGEVRLVQRGSNVVVQTVLQTHHLDRVIHAILEKEARNWPAGAPGARDAARYREALQKAARVAAETQVAPITLGIDYAWGPHSARVTFFRPAIVATEAGLAIEGAVTTTEILEVTEDYLVRNQELIVEDSFGRSAPRVLDLLHDLRGDRAMYPVAGPAAFQNTSNFTDP